MGRDRFEAIVDAYGADPRRWPAPERAAALAFAAVDPAAQALMAQARALDAALDAAPAPQASDLLRARLEREARGLADARAPSRQTVWAMAACLVFGVILGLGGARLAGGEAEAEAALADAFSTAYDSAWMETEG